MHINTNRFYGYDKNEDGRLVINPEQAKVVRWIFESYMDGINPDIIARRLMDKKVPGCMGEPKWTVDTIIGNPSKMRSIWAMPSCKRRLLLITSPKSR